MLHKTFIPRVQIVVVNWRRPSNLPEIIAAFRNQTVPCWLTICEVGGSSHGLPKDVLASADSCFSWDINHGGFNRFIPAFAYRSEFCWFHDDDMIPGPRLVEFLLAWSHLPFSVLGQTGRRVAGQEYKVIEPSRIPEEVDFVCRGYFVRTARLHHILSFTNAIGLARDFVLEEDILMAAAIRAHTGERAWITPRPPPGAEMNARELPAPYACEDMPDHYVRRVAFFNLCRTMTRRIHRTFPRMILLGTPSDDCRSLVAHARSLGIQAWFHDQFPEFPVIAPDVARHDLARFEIGDDDVFVLQAGEELGEALEGPTLGILLQYPRNKVIILSKSLSSRSVGNTALALAQRHYAEHPKLTLVTTTAASQDLARQWFPKADVSAKAPDFALNFPLASEAEPALGEHVLVSVCAGQGIVPSLESVVREVGCPWHTINFDEANVTEGVRAWMLRSKIAEVQRAAAVITNHLDGLLFAYLAGRPTVILPSDDQALMLGLEWFRKTPWVQIAPSLAEITTTLAAVQLASKDPKQSLNLEFTQLASQLRPVFFPSRE